MEKFNINIIQPSNLKKPIAEIFYEGLRWAEISQDTGKLIIQFYPHPQKCWELPYNKAIEVLKQTKEKLLNNDVIKT